MAEVAVVDDQSVLSAVEEAFWDLGYDWTGIDVLEFRSGLDRTELWSRFGSKRDLLDAALTRYAGSFIGPRVAAMETPGAAADGVAVFFSGLADFFEQDPRARRGCLMVNTIAELAGRDELGDRWGAIFRTRLRDAFGNALADSPHHEERCRWLVAQTLGLWLMARFDPLAAAGAARSTVTEIRRWSAGG